MHVAYAVVLLLLLSAGCARTRPDTPVSPPQAAEPQSAAAPQPAAEQPAPAPQPAVSPQPTAAPAAPQPAPAAGPAPAPRVATPATPTPGKISPREAKTPAPTAPAPKPAAPPAAAVAPPPIAAAPAPAAPQTLDLVALKDRLKATKAIGVFTKISLKNKVDDLLEQFRTYYQGKTRLTMTELRQSYNLLMMKVLSLLQDADQTLASAIVSSREAIWNLLSDPKTFAALDI